MNKGMLSFEEALAQLLEAARPVSEIDTLPTQAALGRVLAAAQTSTIAVPPLDNSAMDGYALRAADVPVAGTRLPVSQRIAAGSVGEQLVPGTAARIFTGAPVPPGADAVVMQEQCTADESGGGGVSFSVVPQSGANIRRAGEDIRAGATVLEAGVTLTPQALGLAASVGLAVLPVFRRLRVALFSTGDELAMPGEPLKPGGIYNSNRFLLRGLLEQAGCIVTDLGIVADDLEATRAALRKAAHGHDLILTSGGVSVGEEDHVKPAVQAEGSLDLWKIAIKPGKPLAFGRIGECDFIGLPGNPVACFVTFAMLVRPFLRRRQGGGATTPLALMLPAGFDWPRADSRREFLRVRIGADGRLAMYANQGSGVLTSTHWADGLVDNPPGQAFRAGDVVRYLPLSSLLS